MEIEKADWAGGITLSDVTCADHLSKATHFLKFDGCIVPLCDDCLRYLKEEINAYCPDEQ